MSRFFEAHAGPFTMTVDDTTGNAPDLGVVQTSGIRPSWGDGRRNASPGIVPCSFDVIVDDPTDEVNDRLTGIFNEKDYDITVTGPRGATGQGFRLKLYPKQQTFTEPLSKDVHPDKTRITVYDGLRRLEDLGPGGTSIYQVMTPVFSLVNSALEMWARVPVQFTTGGWAGFYGPNDLSKVLFPDRAFERWGSAWDSLQELCDRFGLLLFQDPYHIVNGEPVWKLIPRIDLGLSVNGVSTYTQTGLGGSDQTRQPRDVVRVPEGSTVVSEGEEFEAAFTFAAPQQLPRDPASSEVPSLALNGNNILRDGNFKFENSGNGDPWYGVSEQATIQSGSAEIRLDPDDANGVDAFWESEPFHIGGKLLDGKLQYDLELESGSQVQVEVAVQSLDEQGNVISTFDLTGANATGIDKTITFTSDGPRLRARVFVPADSSANPVYDFGVASLRLYVNASKIGTGEESDFREVPFTSSATGLLSKGIDSYADMRLNNVPVARNSDIAPTSYYRLIVDATGSGFNFYNTYTAGEAIKERRFRTRGETAQTLKTQLRDEYLGPNTIVVLEDEQGAAKKTLVMDGGRTIFPRNRFTDLTDLTV